MKHNAMSDVTVLDELGEACNDELSSLMTQYSLKVVKLVRATAVMSNRKKDIDSFSDLIVLNAEYMDRMYRVILEYQARQL